MHKLTSKSYSDTCTSMHEQREEKVERKIARVIICMESKLVVKSMTTALASCRSYLHRYGRMKPISGIHIDLFLLKGKGSQLVKFAETALHFSKMISISMHLTQEQGH